MKKKLTIAIAVICVTGFTLCGAVLAQAATTKSTIIGFANMAASVEKGYGTVLELDLTLRNGEPVYKANVIIGGKRVLVYFNAVTGTEIEQKGAVALDEDETKLYNDYNIMSSASGQGKTASEISARAQTSQSAGATISYERAKEIALAKVGGGTVTEIELDRKNGQLVYEVEVKYNGMEYEIDVNAATGEILKYKIDD